jgi:hypothetical protein
MCEIIAIRVWEKLDECRKNDPYFNPKDDSHFKKAIRELSIYDLKVDFLAGKGYREEWGCPNEVQIIKLRFSSKLWKLSSREVLSVKLRPTQLRRPMKKRLRRSVMNLKQ